MTEDARERAKKLLELATKQVEQRLDQVRTLTDDAAQIVKDNLDAENPSFGRAVADLGALSINALTPCVHAAGTEAGGGQGLAGSNQQLVIVFDGESEASNPISFSLAEPVAKVRMKNAIEAGAGNPVISPDQIVARFVADAQPTLILTLIELSQVPTGRYTGNIELEMASGQTQTLELSVECKPSLWWN